MELHPVSHGSGAEDAPIADAEYEWLKRMINVAYPRRTYGAYDRAKLKKTAFRMRRKGRA